MLCGPQAYLNGQLNTTKGAHFNPFDNVTYPIPTNDPSDPFQWDLVFNSSDIFLTFNTSGTQPTLTIYNQSCTLWNMNATDNDTLCNDTHSYTGYVALSELGTQTGLFNFHSIYLGPGVNVTITGNRALVLMSRSTAIFDTPLIATPGTLGVRSLVEVVMGREMPAGPVWTSYPALTYVVRGCVIVMCATGLPEAEGPVHTQQQLLGCRQWCHTRVHGDAEYLR